MHAIASQRQNAAPCRTELLVNACRASNQFINIQLVDCTLVSLDFAASSYFTNFFPCAAVTFSRILNTSDGAKPQEALFFGAMA